MVAFAVAGAAGCRDARPGPHRSGAAPASAAAGGGTAAATDAPPVLPVASSAAPMAPAGAAAASSVRAPPAADAVVVGEDARALETAPFAGLRLLSADTGLLEGTVVLPRSSGVPVDVKLALASAPRALRRPLAYYRLACALDMRIAAVTAVRPLRLDEAAALLAGQPGADELLAKRAAVLNDGTVDALLVLRPHGAREIDADASPEIARFAKWAAAPRAEEGEQASFVRDYVEALVLDYLAANVLRRTVFIDDAAGRLLLPDSASAFPARADGGAVARLLGRLRDVTRFPRRLHQALQRFDPARTWATFAPGSYDTWLLPPRTFIEIQERRAGLLTLIEARIAEHGADVVLSL